MSESSKPLASTSQVAQVVQSFEAAWLEGQAPSIDDYLFVTGMDPSSLLRELVRADLECRLKAGETARVENYLGRYPELRKDTHVLRQLIATEFSLRRQRETGLSLDEFAERFPGHSEQLSKLGDTARPKLPPATPKPEEIADPHQTVARPSPATVFVKMPAAAEVPGYEILGTLGRGGMGVVYKARHLKLNRIVALKMILGGAHADAEMLDRFRREAEAVARIQHPNIVQIYEVGEADGRPFFSLEFVDGGSLDKQLGGTPVPGRSAAALVETLARAMQVAHERGVVHRDLKPANILLQSPERRAESPEPEGRAGKAGSGLLALDFPLSTAKITDFGLAKQLEGESGQTKSGAIMGTPSYMAPEQASGASHTVGPLADVYALGAILYDLVTGRPPFKGSTVLDTLDQVKHQEPVPPSRLLSKVPRDVETICLKCLHKEPGRRYDSALALADDLQRYLAGEPIKARPVGWRERAIKYARRKPWVVAAWAATAAAVLLMIVASGYYLYRRNQDLEAELKKGQELKEKSIQAGLLLREGEQALLQPKTLPRAITVAEAAVALLGEDPGLDELRGQAKRLHADATRIQRFTKLCDQAQYHEMLALEEGDREKHRQAIRQAASEAAALIGLRTEDGPALFDDDHLPPAVRAKLKTESYQLLFPWSNAVALEPVQTDEQRRFQASAALRILERAAALGLTTKAYHMRQSQLLEQFGDAAGAARARQEAEDTQPRLAVDFFLLGLEAKAKTPPDLKGEAAQLRRALEREPRHFWANYYLAANYVKAQTPGRAFEPLTACIDMQPSFPWAYILRGLAHGQAGDFEAALADFNRAEQADPDSLARYGILVNRGVVRVKERQLEAAAADFTEAARLRPKQWQAYANLAETQLQLGHADEALAQLGKAIELQPSAALYRTRARLYLKRPDYAKALPDLEEAIRREPVRDARDLADDQLERGKILYRYGKYDGALQAFDAALAVNPKVPPPQTHQLRAEALIELNRLDEALHSLERVQGAATSATYRARALIKAKRGNYSGAVQDYTQSLEMDRRADKQADPRTLAYRGWAYLISDAPKLALADFDEALKHEECDRVDCYNGRGYARVVLGQWKEAVADAEAALEAKPTLPRHWYNAARIYAQAAARVDPDPARSTNLTREQRRRFENRAVHLLRLACEASPLDQRTAFWKEYVQADPALKPVKQGAAYAQLAAKYGNR